MTKADSRPVILYGAGYPDTLKLIERLARVESGWSVHGFVDDTTTQTNCLNKPILGKQDFLKTIDVQEFRFVNNVFSTIAARTKVNGILDSYGCDVISLIDPDVDVRFTEIGKGTVILKGAQLGARVRIGSHCTIRMNSVVNHDNVLEDYVFIGPGVTLCGYVTLGQGAYVGAGSVIKERIRIGSNAVVGAGSVVVRDVPDNVTVAGVPAKELHAL
jgi:sugar O-acyltransferase (sialic acid O-acetyltransferase NeuD family)